MRPSALMAAALASTWKPLGVVAVSGSFILAGYGAYNSQTTAADLAVSQVEVDRGRASTALLSTSVDDLREQVTALGGTPVAPPAAESLADVPALAAAGRDGANGLSGRDGVAGRDGVDGLPGLDGGPGLDGALVTTTATTTAPPIVTTSTTTAPPLVLTSTTTAPGVTSTTTAPPVVVTATTTAPAPPPVTVTETTTAPAPPPVTVTETTAAPPAPPPDDPDQQVPTGEPTGDTPP